jgi:hypothetical protein
VLLKNGLDTPSASGFWLLDHLEIPVNQIFQIARSLPFNDKAKPLTLPIFQLTIRNEKKPVLSNQPLSFEFRLPPLSGGCVRLPPLCGGCV